MFCIDFDKKTVEFRNMMDKWLEDRSRIFGYRKCVGRGKLTRLRTDLLIVELFHALVLCVGVLSVSLFSRFPHPPPLPHLATLETGSLFPTSTLALPIRLRFLLLQLSLSILFHKITFFYLQKVLRLFFIYNCSSIHIFFQNFLLSFFY